jgi:hypothetical protein
MSWHRSRELPEYRRFLADFDASIEGGLTVEEVRASYLEARRYYQRLLGEVLPHMADLLLQLDAEQVEGLERRLAEDNRKVAKEDAVSSQERRSRSTRRTIDHLEAWTGALDASQRELVASRLRALPDTSLDRMADRRYRQAETLALIRAKPDRDAMVAGLRRLLIETETWRRPEYLLKVQERDMRNFEMLSALSDTLSPHQRDHLHRRLRGLMGDITTLAASR